ncbi:hypothetical protein [Los Azufres archaeal virus 1]|nr:hypothetical protein [Los Azufres archaeal virus 1]
MSKMEEIQKALITISDIGLGKEQKRKIVEILIKKNIYPSWKISKIVGDRYLYAKLKGRGAPSAEEVGKLLTFIYDDNPDLFLEFAKIFEDNANTVKQIISILKVEASKRASKSA